MNNKYWLGEVEEFETENICFNHINAADIEFDAHACKF